MLRFRLRTLLIVVAVLAVACAIMMPAIRAYHERKAQKEYEQWRLEMETRWHSR